MTNSTAPASHRPWLAAGRGARAALLAAALFAPCLACEDPEIPVGPPRCEPEHEHEVDRRLKLGFKALVMGETERARALFQAVLNEEPIHPEAQLGMRLLQGKQAIEPALPDAGGDTQTPGNDGGLEEHAGRIQVAGRWLPLAIPVDAERWRFEELRALAPLRKARDGAGGVFNYYRERKPEGVAVGATDGDALVQAVDLIVLHDTHTRTAREAVVELEGRGGSTHFMIDWDGAVYQLLDLVWEANHSQLAAVDVRSVSIDLVNPVELGTKPGLPDEAEDRGEHRPLSDFARIQNEEVQQWGYTSAQLKSLELLVRALGKVLPRVPLRVPGEGAVPRSILGAPDEARGVIGHVHVSRRAQDPGAGFPWEAFDRALRAP